MSHLVTASSTHLPAAVIASRIEVAQRPSASGLAPQGTSTLESASSTSQNRSGTGLFRWIADTWIAFWSAAWACVTGRKVSPINAAAALARRIDEGNKIIDRHLRKYPSQDVNCHGVLFNMHYSNQVVAKFRGLNEEGQAVDVFAKALLKQLLSSEANAGIANGLLKIESHFCTGGDNGEFIIYDAGRSIMSMHNYRLVSEVLPAFHSPLPLPEEQVWRS